MTQYNPVDYFAQQHVPYFGWDFDTTYCSPKPSTALWGFSYNGCLLAENPSFVSDLRQDRLRLRQPEDR